MEAVIVDPGGEAEKLIAAIEERGLKLTKILLTHGHADHIGATAIISKHFSAPIYGPQKEDAFWIEALAEQHAMFNIEGGPSFTPDYWLEEGADCSIVERWPLMYCIAPVIPLVTLFLLTMQINLSQWGMCYLKGG
ncbi:Probable polyketide biosynthesis zinc-dependent hydrolase pksB [Providencia stuartii]|nr:Probable polyketide biosynthesis zinc-dependent hydrolase pksB [Providencia stuartii]